AFVLLAVLVALEWLFDDTLLQFASHFLSSLSALPKWMVETVVVGTHVLSVVLLVGGFALAVVRGRWRMLLPVGVGVGVAIALVVVFNAITERTPAPVVHLSHVLGQLDDGRFPSALGIAVIAAAVTAAAPWLSRRWRRLGWVLVLGLVITRVIGA